MASSSAPPTTAEIHPPHSPSLPFFQEFNGVEYDSRSDLELAISLEFLSCMKSDQIIPIHKITNVVIPVFRYFLSKANPLLQPDGNTSSNDISQFQELFDKVERDLSEIKATFQGPSKWEHRLDTLIKGLMLFDWEGTAFSARTRKVKHLNIALCDIDKMVSELKLHVSDIFSSKYSNNQVFTSEKQTSDLISSKKFSDGVILEEFQTRYENLNQQQQYCLLYFSALPENSVIKKTILMYLWIGEGFINATTIVGNATEEEIAAQILMDLIAKGFIIPVNEKGTGEFNSCQLNPDLQSKVFMRAKNAEFFNFDSNGNPTAKFIRSRRACLVRTEEGSIVANSNHEKLLTLFNVNETCLDFSTDWFSEMKNVTVIHLGDWQSSSNNYIEVENENFLRSLNSNVLRYLSLNGISRIQKLPRSIRRLSNLRILYLKQCWNLEELPDEIALLKNLTHLDMSECYLMDSMPKGLTQLSELQVLKGFVIGGQMREDQCVLGDLVKLKKLRKLSIYNYGDANRTNAELHCLSKFNALRILAVSWMRVSSQSKSGNRVMSKIMTNMKLGRAEVALPSSSLPSGLEKVDLRSWPLPMMPNWLKPWELNDLKKLYIRGGNLCALHHDHPSKTKILRLKFLRELKMDWPVLTKLFPNLIYMEKVDCPGLLSFPSDGEWRLGDCKSEASTSRTE